MGLFDVDIWRLNEVREWLGKIFYHGTVKIAV